MKTLHTTILLTFVLLCSGCYTDISGKVADGVTGNPLEGAVVLAQWTKTHGKLGLGTNHTLYKIVETETNEEGMFFLSGVDTPFVDPPEMVIYKKGYVPWRNDRDFMHPTWRSYEKNIWQNKLTYKLAPWKEEYSKVMVEAFVATGILSFMVGNNKIPKFKALQSELRKEERAERKLKWEQKKKR